MVLLSLYTYFYTKTDRINLNLKTVIKLISPLKSFIINRLQNHPNLFYRQYLKNRIECPQLKRKGLTKMTKADMIETLLKKEEWASNKIKIIKDKYGEESEQLREACAEWYIAFSLIQEMGLRDKKMEYRRQRLKV